MKLPRDLSGMELAQALVQFGYIVDRQSGSHMRLTTQTKGEHHLTIPAHTPLKLGTLNSILRDVSSHLKMDRNQLLSELFR